MRSLEIDAVPLTRQELRNKVQFIPAPLIHAIRGREPKFVLRWRNLTIGAKGEEAIKAVHGPLFAVLLIHIATVIVVASLVVWQPEWLHLRELFTRWLSSY